MITNDDGIFARRNDDGNLDLLDSDGHPLTRLSDPWPIVWPIGSDVSAYYEHHNGITLEPCEFIKIAKVVPVEDENNQ